MDSPTTTITPPPAYGFEARITPWVGAYPAQTFEEHAAVAAGNWTLSQWGASQSQSGGADFVIQSGVEAYLVNIAQVPRCGCSSFASPCGVSCRISRARVTRADPPSAACCERSRCWIQVENES